MAMASTKRPRACDICHSLKIKCELGSTGGPGPCDRCMRLGKDCTITPPKSQKDRVAELEAQVAALTKLLEGQKLEAQSADPSLNESSSLSKPDAVLSKKRKLAEGSTSSDKAGSSLLASRPAGLPK